MDKALDVDGGAAVREDIYETIKELFIKPLPPYRMYGLSSSEFRRMAHPNDIGFGAVLRPTIHNDIVDHGRRIMVIANHGGMIEGLVIDANYPDWLGPLNYRLLPDEVGSKWELAPEPDD